MNKPIGFDDVQLRALNHKRGGALNNRIKRKSIECENNDIHDHQRESLPVDAKMKLSTI